MFLRRESTSLLSFDATDLTAKNTTYTLTSFLYIIPYTKSTQRTVNESNKRICLMKEYLRVLKGRLSNSFREEENIPQSMKVSII
jgi:hypothetical protein